MSEETYNGWTNRETWAVALHINNDQGWQESVHEAIRERDELGEWLDTKDGMSESTAARYAGDAIRENVEEFCDVETLPAGIMGGTDPDALASWANVRDDIGSLWRVNWTELGAAFLSDLEESTPHESYADGTCTDECVATHPEHKSTRGED